MLHPKEQPPQTAVLEGTGRKPAEKHEPADKKADYSIQSYGYGSLAVSLLTECAAKECLEAAFGADKAIKITALAAFLCRYGGSSLSGLRHFVEENLQWLVDLSFDRRRAGELLTELTPEERGNFFTLWLGKHNAECSQLFYDVTSFSTYSGELTFGERGYNRDHEDLPQINVGLFCSREHGLPLFFCTYNGSVNDGANMNYAVREAKSHGMKCPKRRTLVVTDGGFKSPNILCLSKTGYRFIMGVSPDVFRSTVKPAYEKWIGAKSIQDLNHRWSLGGDSQYISGQSKITLGGVAGTLVMYRDTFACENAQKAIIEEKESLGAELEATAKAPCATEFHHWAKHFLPYFTVTRTRGRKGFTYVFNEQDFDTRMLMAGRITLFCSEAKKDVDEKQIMSVYRSKEAVEADFDAFKNSLSDKRLHIHGDKQMEGKLFVMFIALILWRQFNTRLRDYLNKHNMTLHDAFEELADVQLIKIRDEWLIRKAVTKIQRELLTLLGANYKEISRGGIV